MVAGSNPVCPNFYMNILLTNDDGIGSVGLLCLKEILEENYGEDVMTIVPDRDRSGSGHGVTVFQPVQMRELGKRTYTLDGSPVDCVKIGVEKFLCGKVDLVVSGINNGPNMGVDVHYSGTVAAAREACLHGVKGVAFSVDDYNANQDYDRLKKYCLELIQRILEYELPSGVLLNVNFPNSGVEIKGMRVTKLGVRVYHDEVIEREVPAPHRSRYFWFKRDYPGYISVSGSDFESIENGLISLTPLRVDQTEEGLIPKLRDWEYHL